ncbi:MAG: hypothetical protein KGZ43_06830 [Sulfuritalea sp.]|nr:hypothetical protein [Sulfuritalea sp.]
MKSTNRSARRIALAVCLPVSAGLLPQTAIPMPTELQVDAALNHYQGSSSLSAEDMIHLFGNGANGSTHLRIASLTEEKMLATEGKNPVAVIAAVATGAAFLTGGAASIGMDVLNGQSVNWNNAIASATGGAWTAGSAALMTVSGVGPITTVALSPLIGGGSLLATLNGLNSLSNSWGGGGAGDCNSCHATR